MVDVCQREEFLNGDVRVLEVIFQTFKVSVTSFKVEVGARELDTLNKLIKVY
jgi:hypothetical protein